VDSLPDGVAMASGACERTSSLSTRWLVPSHSANRLIDSATMSRRVASPSGRSTTLAAIESDSNRRSEQFSDLRRNRPRASW
jgi:hypothetical protein